MSFGGDYGKDTGSFVSAVENTIAAMVAAKPEITIKDETNEFDDKDDRFLYLTQSSKEQYIDVSDGIEMENKKEIAFLFYFTYGSPLIFCDLFASS